MRSDNNNNNKLFTHFVTMQLASALVLVYSELVFHQLAAAALRLAAEGKLEGLEGTLGQQVHWVCVAGEGVRLVAGRLLATWLAEVEGLLFDLGAAVSVQVAVLLRLLLLLAALRPVELAGRLLLVLVLVLLLLLLLLLQQLRQHRGLQLLGALRRRPLLAARLARLADARRGRQLAAAGTGASLVALTPVLEPVRDGAQLEARSPRNAALDVGPWTRIVDVLGRHQLVGLPADAVLLVAAALGCWWRMSLPNAVLVHRAQLLCLLALVALAKRNLVQRLVPQLLELVLELKRNQIDGNLAQAEPDRLKPGLRIEDVEKCAVDLNEAAPRPVVLLSKLANCWRKQRVELAHVTILEAWRLEGALVLPNGPL